MTIRDEYLQDIVEDNLERPVPTTMQRKIASELISCRVQLATVMKSEQEWMELFMKLVEFGNDWANTTENDDLYSLGEEVRVANWRALVSTMEIKKQQSHVGKANES
jgi:hypothetical protein